MAISRQNNETNVDPADVARFDALGRSWWDPRGPMAALHKLNPVRVGYIEDMLREALGLGVDGSPLNGLRVLDVGCGGGLLSEALARQGALVTAIDPAPASIAIAQAHARESGLSIDYRATTIEALAADQANFDAVVMMEVVEHVIDRRGFVKAVAERVRPGGMLFVATLNRTPKSYALGIVAAEYVLGWVPRGTHDWQRFVTPAELARDLKAGGLSVYGQSGAAYHLPTGRWRRSEDVAVNYMMCAERAG